MIQSEEHGITAAETRALIDKVGNSREKLTKAVETMKAKKK